MYVYILVSKLVSDVEKNKLDGFMILGVYSEYDRAEEEMRSHFIRLSGHDSVKDIRIKSGLEFSKGKSRVYQVIWKDGGITEITIQERILDQ